MLLCRCAPITSVLAAVVLVSRSISWAGVCLTELPANQVERPRLLCQRAGSDRILALSTLVYCLFPCVA